MARATSKKKIDWEKLLKLPKWQRDVEIKKMLKKQEEEKNDRMDAK